MRNDGRVGIESCPLCQGVFCSVSDEGELNCIRNQDKDIQLPVDGVSDEVVQISHLVNKYQLMGGSIAPNQLILGVDVFRRMQSLLQVNDDHSYSYQWLDVVVDYKRTESIKVGHVLG